MATLKNERIYDELLCYLGDPVFQIPVRTFMDEHCLIFDPSIEPGEEHHIVHTRYKRLIDTLLDSLCKDSGITLDEGIESINKMSETPDIRDVFHVLFEQVAAANDFNIFLPVMIKRNIMIQEQVLLMIMAATGSIPESMMPTTNSQGQDMTPAAVDSTERDMLHEIMKESRDKFDVSKMDPGKDSDMRKTIEMSKQEALALRAERKQMEENVKHLTLSQSTPKSKAPTSSPAKTSAVSQVLPPSGKAVMPPAESTPRRQEGKSDSTAVPVAVVPPKAVSSAEAANQWLQSAHAEVSGSQSATTSMMTAQFAKMDPDEVKQRQEFLRQQRDKLLTMKKQARAKQLQDHAQPQRPQSAKAARSVMVKELPAPPDGKNEEDAKKLAMRRAIADKLRREVLNS
ncbi:Cilia- and flagella-associated protein 36 [Lamellibrachia satsuma]|nr:Cilia- and flagella-associated protein 36 [Lamellibrachia satsuma]